MSTNEMVSELLSLRQEKPRPSQQEAGTGHPFVISIGSLKASG